MKLIRNLFLAVLCIFVSVLESKTLKSQVEHMKSRHYFHKEHDFERLAIEFKYQLEVNTPVSVRHNTQAGELSSHAFLDYLAFNKAVNEKRFVIDRHVNQSVYLGSVTLGHESSQASPLITRIKKHTPQLITDVFWLNQPPRLVIDIYPPGSPREYAGRKILQ